MTKSIDHNGLRLALGSDPKGAFALAEPGDAHFEVMGSYGDLSEERSFHWWSEAVIRSVAGEQISRVIVDRHPAYRSRTWGRQLADKAQVPVVEIPHHAAHAAASLAACHRRSDAGALALILDGSGYGEDGTTWGCEFLELTQDGQAQRLGHLRPVASPADELAAREPWRMAASWLKVAGKESRDAALDGIRQAAGPALWDEAWMDSAADAIAPTSSAGRLFDAAAAILGLATRTSSRTEAALLLERTAELAPVHAGERPLPYLLDGEQLDAAPLLAELIDQRSRGADIRSLARSFHVTLVDALTELVRAAAPSSQGVIALGGGCFVNKLLRALLPPRLTALGLHVALPPPSLCTDLAIPLGQLVLDTERQKVSRH